MQEHQQLPSLESQTKLLSAAVTRRMSADWLNKGKRDLVSFISDGFLLMAVRTLGSGAYTPGAFREAKET